MRQCRREDFEKRGQADKFDAYAVNQMESSLLCPNLDDIELLNYIDSTVSKSFMFGVAACN